MMEGCSCAWPGSKKARKEKHEKRNGCFKVKEWDVK
jgi:hypothetical protein